MLKALILVIEDDPIAREALALFLSDWGAETLLSDGLDDPQRLVGERAPELVAVITDFHLGAGPDGVTLASRLKKAAPQVRVLVVSAEADGRAKTSAAQAGFETMTKPVRPSDIIAWLERE